MSALKVLMITPSYYPAVRYGGTIYSIHALSKALIDAGVELKVLTTNVDGPIDAHVPLDGFTEVDGVPVHYFESKGLFRRFYYSKSMKRFLTAHAHEYALLNVNAAFLWPNSYIARVAKKNAIPWVWTPRGMLVKSLFSQKSAWYKWPWWWLEGRRLVEEADLVHCTSGDELIELDALEEGAKAVVISNGVDIPPKAEVVRRSNQLLYVGRISWKKRIDLLIDAMVILTRQHDDLLLVIAGNDEEGLTHKLKARAQALGVSARIDFIGAIDSERRNQLMAESTALALVSEQENFGNVVIEALAVACPCVVTNGCGVKEAVLDSTAGFVVPGRVEDIADALHLLLADTKKAQKLGELGAHYVKKHYRWENKAKELRQEYTRLVKSQ